jgi:hypothetical protein
MRARSVKVYSTANAFQAEEIKALFSEENIPIFVFEKNDTAYPWLGEIEFYSQPEDVIRSIKLLKDNGYE